MESLKFVLVSIAIINGQFVFGYHNVVNEDIMSTEAGAVLQRTVNEITAKYDIAIHEIQAVVAQQQEHIEALQKDKSVLQEAVSTLKTEVEHYDQRLNELTNTVVEQGKHIKALEVSNRMKSVSMENLQHKLQVTERSSTCKCSKKNHEYETSSKTNGTSTKPEVDSIDTSDTLTGHQGRIRRAFVETEVAFFAYISHNGDADHMGVDQDIVFDHAVTNIGNGYQPHHGTFLAPVAGTYVFSATLHVPVNSRANFVADGNVVAKFYADIDEPTQVSQTIVVSLRKGADVSIQNMQSDNSYYGEEYTTFSGFLLYENADNPVVVG